MSFLEVLRTFSQKKFLLRELFKGIFYRPQFPFNLIIKDIINIHLQHNLKKDFLLQIFNISPILHL